MLILTRRVDERILIGDNITLCVLDIEGNRVRLGLDAPKEIAILREEIHHKYAGEASNDAQHPFNDFDDEKSA
jgi:carbon storage regulator